ncbi:phospholipase D family protein [Falsiroseomonas oryziterrae]|uniref:phospholipase D family protein n=1 Tax=Falsiroseomonas oryziterrae TaxID=2911368 RepID=UPI001F33667F|nr:phospholipase D family protein [Roseomonas sp. NPKOSM-4]
MTQRLAPSRPMGPPATRLERAVRASLAALGQRGPEARQGGVTVVCKAAEAFAIRAASARAAGRTLDLQYYVWRGDLTGRLLAREVLAAADRGVAVRMLLDDVFAIGHERVLAALDAHPNIEVRLFNATRWRRFGRLGYALEVAFGGWHLTRRMHNKNWVADGQLAVVGGRNIGNEYFGLDADGAISFRDLDLVLAGAPAAGATEVFERYWRSDLSRPARDWSAASETPGGLDRLRRELDAATREPDAPGLLVALRESPSRRIRRGLTPVAEGAVRVVAESPEKARRGLGARKRARAAGGIAADIADALRVAKREARLISPYFVPGPQGLALLRDLAERGVKVSVVTNSLAATDVVAVHGGYMKYRRALLRAGIVLYELKPGPEDEKASLLGSRGGAALHTKALVVDGMRAFVGSFNLDPRSAALNTEMGAFVQNPSVAKEIAEEQERLMDPAFSWRLELRDGRIAWVDSAGGALRRRFAEPGASWRRTAVAWLARVLPVEEQL